MTVIVKANDKVIPLLITADTGFVGLRMPNNKIALDLIQQSGLPIAAPSANKFGHISPTKAEHVYNDFYLDSEVTIIDGGSCDFGIESTVLKIVELPEEKFELCILRKGGVSEKALHEATAQFGDKIVISAKQHVKKETENLEGPGQFLRHYSPNIDSFLYNGKADVDLSDAVFIDFNAQYKHLQPMHYIDLSSRGSLLEAVNQLYDILRWAELREDAKKVLIADI